MKDQAVENVHVDGQAAQVICSSQDRERWLEERKSGIGASESAALMDLSPYTSTFTLWHERKGLSEREFDSASEEHMGWGSRLESVIAEVFERKTERRVADAGMLLRSRSAPWMMATPDRLQWDGDRVGLLELKLPSEYELDSWLEDAPLIYQCQLQHQMAVTGIGWGTVVALVGGRRLLWHDYEAHPRFQHALIARCKWFYDLLQGDEPPEPDPHPSTTRLLSRLRDQGQVIDLTDNAATLWEEYQQAKAAEREAKQRAAHAHDMLAAILGTCPVGVLPNGAGYITWRQQSASEYTVPAKTYRVMRFSKKLKEGRMRKSSKEEVENIDLIDLG